MKETPFSLMDMQVLKVQEVLADGSWEIIRKFIVPYLFTGSVFPSSREEFRKEMEEFYDEDEVEALCENERPEIAEGKWNDFGYTFLLAWDKKYETIVSYNYLPKRLIPKNISAEDILEIAKNNLSETDFKLNVINVEDEANDSFELISAHYSHKGVPNFSTSLLLDSNAKEEMHKLLGEDFVMIPYYKDEVFAVRKSEYESRKREEIFSVIEEMAGKYHEIFSDKVFLCGNDVFLEI